MLDLLAPGIQHSTITRPTSATDNSRWLTAIATATALLASLAGSAAEGQTYDLQFTPMGGTVSEAAGFLQVSVSLIGCTNPQANLSITAQVVKLQNEAEASDVGNPSPSPFILGRDNALQVITVPIFQDNILEGDELFNLRIGKSTLAEISLMPCDEGNLSLGSATYQATFTIIDDDLRQVSIDDVVLVEGDSGATSSAVFTVTMTQPTQLAADIAGPWTVTYATTDSSARVADGDYQSASGQLAFGSNDLTATITVLLNGDDKFEPDETYFVDLLGASGTGVQIIDSRGRGSINNDDPQPLVSIADITLSEGDAGTTNANLTVTLSSPTANNVTVQYTTLDGSATVASGDYQAASGTVIFDADTAQLTRSLTVLVNGDNELEGDEEFIVRLTSSTHAGISLADATVTLTNDDVAVMPGISIGDMQIVEGDSGEQNLVFTVNLEEPTTLPVSVDYITESLTASPGSDYNPETDNLTIPPGSPSGEILVRVFGDTDIESDETFAVRLSNPVNGIFRSAGANVAIGTILNDDNAPPFVSIADLTMNEGDSGSTDFVFIVTLSEAAGSVVDVNWMPSDGSAIRGEDYTSPFDRKLPFPPGSTSQTLTVMVFGDTDFEGDETFNITLVNPTGVQIADGDAVGTILNDDSPIVPDMSIEDLVVVEGNSGSTTAVFNVLLSEATTELISADWGTTRGAGTATEDVDYGVTGGMVTFDPGDVAKTVEVEIFGDTTVEDDETFLVKLSDAPGFVIVGGNATCTILNDDNEPPFVSILDADSDEGDQGTTRVELTVTLSEALPADLLIGYSLQPNTADDSDYLDPGAQTLTIPSGSLSAPLPVDIRGDTEIEEDESFTVMLDSIPATAQLADGEGRVTIRNDDQLTPPPAAQVTISDLTLTEGDQGTTNAVFTVTVTSSEAQTVSVDYTTEDGSAQAADQDYRPAAGKLVFSNVDSSAAQAISVEVIGDQRLEDDEDFFVQLSGAGLDFTRARARATLSNDDQGALPALSISDLTLAEGDSGNTSIQLMVSLSTAAAGPVEVSYATRDGSANAPGDYPSRSGRLSFPTGSLSQPIELSAVGDSDVEMDETFFVDLANPSAATLADGSGQVTLTNDDSGPLPELTIGDMEVVEGDQGNTNAVFQLTLSTAGSSPVTVSYGTTDGSASEADGDYLSASGQLTFDIGQTSQAITVQVVGDRRLEGDENFFVDLSAISGASLMDSRGRGRILNDDQGQLPSLTVADATLQEGDSGSSNATFRISLSAAVNTQVAVDIATQDGSASTADGDYQALSRRLVFQPGQLQIDVAVQVFGDERVENDETFTVLLTNPAGATLSDDSASGTIFNDDAFTVPSISIADRALKEGDSGSTAVELRVQLSAPSGRAVQVDFATRDGSATANDDYRPTSGRLNFAPGQVQRELTVEVLGDTTEEPDESFSIVLSNPLAGLLSDATGRVHITNDDVALGRLRLLPPANTQEAAGEAVIEVERFGPPGRAVEVTVTASPGSAEDGSDFAARAQVLSWPAGELGIRQFRFPLVDDSIEEGDETIRIELSKPVDATIDEPGMMELIVIDDDTPMTIEPISEPQTTATVGDLLELRARVSREDGRPVEGALVDWSIAGEAEISGDPTTLSDSAGEVSQSIKIGSRPDQIVVTATVRGTEASALFELTAEGDLAEVTGNPGGGDGDTIADVLDETCPGASGELGELCDYVFDLDNVDQVELIDQITPDDELEAQATATLDAPQVQLRNVLARLNALRGGTRETIDQLAFDNRGQGLNPAALRIAMTSGSDLDQLRQQIDAALVAGQGELLAEPRGGAASADPASDPSTEDESPWGVFVNGRVSFGKRPQRGQDPGFDIEVQGLTAGADYRFGKGVLGAAVGFFATDSQLAQGGGSLKADGWALSVYASHFAQHFYLDGVVTYGWSDYELERNILLPHPFRGQRRFIARGTPAASQLAATLGAGYDFTLSSTRLTGFARLSWVDADIDGYSELGAGPFDLNLAAQNLKSLLSETGAEVSLPISYSWGVLQPILRGSYLHEFEDNSRLIRGSFSQDLSGNEFVIATDAPDRDFFNFAAGLSAILPHGRTLYLIYDTDLERDDLRLYTLTAGARLQF